MQGGGCRPIPNSTSDVGQSNPDPHFGGRASEMIVRGLVAIGVSIRVLLMNGRVNLRNGSIYWLWCGVVCWRCRSKDSPESLHLSST